MLTSAHCVRQPLCTYLVDAKVGGAPGASDTVDAMGEDLLVPLKLFTHFRLWCLPFRQFRSTSTGRAAVKAPCLLVLGRRALPVLVLFSSPN